VIAALFVATNAFAGENAGEQADHLFNEGRHTAETNDYARACKLFEESFRLDPAIGTLVNLGDCAEHLGEIERAFTAYKTAAARMTPGDDRAARVHARIDHIEAHSAKLSLKVDDAPEGTVVTLDGATIDPRTSPIHVAKGAHVVLVTAVGFGGARFAITLGEGESRALSLTPGTALEAVLPTTTLTHDESHGPSWALPTAIVALGAGVASAWVGSLAGVVAIDRRDVQSANCDASNRCTQAGVDAAHDGATWATTSTAAFVASGVLLAAGGTFLAIALTKHTTKIAFGPGGLFLRGTFR
jgi:hypothetical protein